MTDDATTARAQRQRAAASGQRDDAVDRRSPAANPRGNGSETPTRDRQNRIARDVAEDIEIDRRGVGTVDRLGAGVDVFLRTVGGRQFGSRVRREFADEADFVAGDDVDPQVDQQAIAAQPVVADDRRPDVAERAREQTAADAEFIQRDDLRAEVGPRGVDELRVAEDRRPAVADRTRQGLAAEDPFAEPDDFKVTVGERGIADAGLTAMGERRRAGRQFEDQTRLESIDPEQDIVEDGDGFGLGEDPQRELAAMDFADETPVDAFDPAEDITRADDGFGLAPDAEREVAAREFEQQLDQFGRGELDAQSDIREAGGGLGLAEDPAREVAADRIDDDTEEIDIGPGDIELEQDEDGFFQGTFEEEVER